jgi:hypothetical protein
MTPLGGETQVETIDYLNGQDFEVNRRRDRTLTSRKIAGLAGHKGGASDGGPA